MKIAILTNFLEFQPGYSLTGIVKDQVTMLHKYGHEVHLFVNEKYHGEPFENAYMHCKIPFAHLTDYQSKRELSLDHKATVKATASVLRNELVGFDFAFTHDFIFTGWFLPYGLGCREAGKYLPDTYWLHWIHSIPTAGRDWWRIQWYGRQHKIIYPNETDRVRVAEQYHGAVDDVRVIPHIKDLRSWFDFDPETIEFLDWCPEIMQSDIVQVYPASVDRLEAKRVREVILILAKLKDMGVSVCLVLANQWATGTQQKQDIDRYKRIATRNGLRVGREVVFSSEFKSGKYEVGLPKRILRELSQCANLFIFPTREESFGLVLPEAILSGGVLPIINRSLTMQLEVSGFTTLGFDFGSYNNKIEHPNEGNFLQGVAMIILGRMQQNESIMAKTFVRKRYNWDNIYNRFYAPIMAEVVAT